MSKNSFIALEGNHEVTNLLFITTRECDVWLYAHGYVKRYDRNDEPYWARPEKDERIIRKMRFIWSEPQGDYVLYHIADPAGEDWTLYPDNTLLDDVYWDYPCADIDIVCSGSWRECRRIQCQLRNESC